MARGEPIPDTDRVARATHPENVDDDIILPSAFSLTQRDKGKLSTDWVECVHDDPKRRNIGGSLRRFGQYLKIKPQIIAILRAREIRRIHRMGRRLDAVEDPHIPNRPCHSAIIGMKYDPLDLELQQDLADLANRGEKAPLE